MARGVGGDRCRSSAAALAPTAATRATPARRGTPPGAPANERLGLLAGLPLGSVPPRTQRQWKTDRPVIWPSTGSPPARETPEAPAAGSAGGGSAPSPAWPGSPAPWARYTAAP